MGPIFGLSLGLSSDSPRQPVSHLDSPWQTRTVSFSLHSVHFVLPQLLNFASDHLAFADSLWLCCSFLCLPLVYRPDWFRGWLFPRVEGNSYNVFYIVYNRNETTFSVLYCLRSIIKCIYLTCKRRHFCPRDVVFVRFPTTRDLNHRTCPKFI
jgi:hypothetical protein